MSGRRRLAAIMVTDTVGYSAAVQEDEAGALRLLREQERLLRPAFREYGGREVKSTGDGFLVEFESALKATECAIEIQKQMDGKRTADPTHPPMEVRIGIHLGDVEERDGDIFGDAVNIAARVEPTAEPGGVAVSAQVYDQVRNKVPNLFHKLPPTQLKNLKLPVEIYRIVMPWGRPAPQTLEVVPTTRIAVLPFSNISPDPKDEYFADGLTEELITMLSQIQDLRVIARTSVAPYKASPKPIPQIGAELGVGSVMEGSVRKSGDQLRITAQLIEVASQEHIWAETYDRRLEDVFAVQTEVARKVADVLRVKLGKGEESRLAPGHEVRPDSYLAYLQGRTLMMNSYAESAREEALRQFEHAVELDPSNARAYAGMADVTHMLGLWWHPESRAEYEARAHQYAQRAIELDPNLAEAHSSRGLLLYDGLEWEAAEKEAKIALELNPGSSIVRWWYGNLLMEKGRPGEALRELKLAVEADPHSRAYLLILLDLLLYLGRLEEAGAELERLRILDRAGRIYVEALAWWHYARGDNAKALKEARRASLLPDDEGKIYSGYTQVQIAALTGKEREARKLLAELEREPSEGLLGELVHRAEAYACLGDRDTAYQLYNKAVDLGGASVHWLRLDPDAEPMRKDPRYHDLLKRLKLE